jgi:hypothetical protein
MPATPTAASCAHFRLAHKTPKEAKGHLDDNEVSSSGARCAGITGLRAWEPELPNSVDSGNLALNGLVIHSIECRSMKIRR